MQDRTERLELVTTILLGVATATAAWCTYEGQLWGSEQLANMARANKLQIESLRATDVSTRNTIVDAATFAKVLEAEAKGEHRLARVLIDLARPDFRPALQSWLARHSTSDVPTTTPFDDPAYRAAVQKPSADLEARADASLAAASIANENSDLFVMRTVMIALALFFLGIAGQLRSRAPRRLAVSFGALVLILTMLSLTRLERAPRPNRKAHPAAAAALNQDRRDGARAVAEARFWNGGAGTEDVAKEG
jgi:hypothetical protein